MELTNLKVFESKQTVKFHQDMISELMNLINKKYSWRK